MNLRIYALTTDELHALAKLDLTSPEGMRLQSLASELWAQRVLPLHRRPHGRWPLLEWFARQERIMSQDELAAALARYRTDLAAVRESTPAPRTAA